MEKPNFCALHKIFDVSFLSYNVKNIYKKLQHDKQDYETWKKIINNRKTTFQNTCKNIREHNNKVIMKHFEPVFYDCIFCGESKFQN
eukprot:Pgem_evm1s15026